MALSVGVAILSIYKLDYIFVASRDLRAKNETTALTILNNRHNEQYT